MKRTSEDALMQDLNSLHSLAVKRDFAGIKRAVRDLSAHEPMRKWSKVLNVVALSAEEPAVDGNEQEDDLSSSGVFVSTAVLSGKHFSDIAGLSSVKEVLMESMVYPRLYPGFFRPNFAPFKRILLFGPPGTGKSSLARAAAAHAHSHDPFACFAELSASDMLSQMFGGSEARVRSIFAEACLRGLRRGPVVLYLDEIDSLARSRSASEDDTTRRVKNELLRGLEAIEETPDAYCIASTNVPWDLDDAIVRRFERRILVPLPDAETRRSLLQTRLGKEFSLDEATALSEGYSGSDLTSVCRAAAMMGVRELIANAGLMSFQERASARPRPVCEKDVLHAMKVIRPSVSSATIERHMEWAAKFGEM